MLTADEIIWGYRFLLDRDPESSTTLDHHRETADWRSFRQTLMGSTEFQAKAGAYRNPDRWVLADLGDRRMWVNLADRSVSFPCLQDDYEPAETRVVRRLVRQQQAFMDIGANIGWFSTIAATIVGEQGRVTAFEPRPETFHWLLQTLQLAPVPVEVHQVALADHQGEMNLTWGENTPNPGGSRLVHGALPEGQEGTTVPLRRLDSFPIERCDFIKIDVEGAEMSVFAGGERVLDAFRPIIMSEVHDEQLRDVSRCSSADYIGFFGRKDYACLSLDGARLPAAHASSAGLLTNVVFVPAEKVGMVEECLRT